MVQHTIRFLSLDARYTVELPEFVNPAAELSSVVRLFGAPHLVLFRPHARFSSEHQGQVDRGSFTKHGTSIKVYERQEEPRLLIPYWELASGNVCVSIETNSFGWNGVGKITDEMRVVEDSHPTPRITMSRALQGGDLREPDQRDEVSYFADPDYAGPSSVRLSWAGGFASDRRTDTGTNLVVTRGTALGVNVTCDGRREFASEIERWAESVAESVSATS